MVSLRDRYAWLGTEIVSGLVFDRNGANINLLQKLTEKPLRRELGPKFGGKPLRILDWGLRYLVG